MVPKLIGLIRRGHEEDRAVKGVDSSGSDCWPAQHAMKGRVGACAERGLERTHRSSLNTETEGCEHVHSHKVLVKHMFFVLNTDLLV